MLFFFLGGEGWSVRGVGWSKGGGVGWSKGGSVLNNCMTSSPVFPLCTSPTVLGPSFEIATGIQSFAKVH